MNKEFYSIGRGSLNLNGRFYYGLDYPITDFMRNMEQEITNLKQVLNEVKEILGQYRHYYLPDENQNSKNEDLVERSYAIIDKALGDENK